MVTRVISATAKAGVEMSVQHSPPKAPPEGPEAFVCRPGLDEERAAHQRPSLPSNVMPSRFNSSTSGSTTMHENLNLGERIWAGVLQKYNALT